MFSNDVEEYNFTKKEKKCIAFLKASDRFLKNTKNIVNGLETPVIYFI